MCWKCLKRKQRRRFQVLCPETGRYLKVPKSTYWRKHLPWKRWFHFWTDDRRGSNYVRKPLCLLMSRLLNGKTKMEHHEGQSERFKNEVLTMDFCGTLSEFSAPKSHRSIECFRWEAALTSFWWGQDIFEKRSLWQVMTEDKNSHPCWWSGHYRYLSIDARCGDNHNKGHFLIETITMIDVPNDYTNNGEISSEFHKCQRFSHDNRRVLHSISPHPAVDKLERLFWEISEKKFLSPDLAVGVKPLWNNGNGFSITALLLKLSTYFTGYFPWKSPVSAVGNISRKLSLSSFQRSHNTDSLLRNQHFRLTRWPEPCAPDWNQNWQFQTRFGVTPLSFSVKTKRSGVQLTTIHFH